jgi:hypothetical protein
MPTTAASRRPATEPTDRRCVQCGTPLPAGSRAVRKFCSTRCRVQQWHEANPPPRDLAREESDRLFNRTNRAHYHGPVLVGHRDNVPWFGESCPPECPGVRDGETYRPAPEYLRR